MVIFFNDLHETPPAIGRTFRTKPASISAARAEPTSAAIGCTSLRKPASDPSSKHCLAGQMQPSATPSSSLPSHGCHSSRCCCHPATCCRQTAADATTAMNSTPAITVALSSSATGHESSLTPPYASTHKPYRTE
uniref:Uncharacterized protein n=1 Tax=Oryza sativa subsp. japonica TaxID=39947 RepID=Q6YWK0_ORYSJ|nr:hypothetical protein [Oryza sativa Japonica Group]